MKRTINSFALLLMLACLGAVALHAADNAPSSNPLNSLTKKQRAHYEAYDKLNTLKASNQQFDRSAVNGDLYAPVSEWCAASAPKYKFESMKAGDKAKETKNERMKKELVEKSTIYADMFKLCEDIVKSYSSKNYSSLNSKMQKLAGFERDCKTKGYQFLKREWLTSSEYDALYFRTQAMLTQQKKQQKGAGRKASDVRKQEAQPQPQQQQPARNNARQKK